MEIKAVKFRRDGFYTQPFVFGGEEGPDKFDKNIRYRGSLQNYLIDTGSEVILVDTGITAGTPEEAPDESSMIFTGKDICTSTQINFFFTGRCSRSDCSTDTDTTQSRPFIIKSPKTLYDDGKDEMPL